MIQDLILAARTQHKQATSQKEVSRLLASHSNFNTSADAKVNALTAVLHLTSGLGLIAIVLLASMFFNPSLADKFRSLSPFSSQVQNHQEEKIPAPDLGLLMATPELIATSNEEEAKKEVEASTNYKLIGNPKQQQLVTNWLAKRYRVANEAVDMLVSAAYLTAKETKLDPLLILSVIAIESRFNPFSESPVGAQGLMQVMSKVHHEKFSELGGIKAALNPVANIKVGAMILREYVASAGSIEAGLKRYVGAADNETDGGYGNLVMAEYKRLKEVAAGKSISIFSTAAKPTLIARPQEPINEKNGDDVTQKTNEKLSIDQVVGI